MSVFKIQKIRVACSQCGSSLGSKCAACLANPKREPKIIELFNWPRILKTAECGCCIMISCERSGCTGKPWKYIGMYKEKLSRVANFYCNKKCHLLARNALIDTRSPANCGWCGKTVLRRASHMKTFKAVYCRPDHYHMHMAKLRHQKREAVKKALDTPNRALLECRGKCRDITEHDTKTEMASCLTCGTKRSHTFKVDAAVA